MKRLSLMGPEVNEGSKDNRTRPWKVELQKLADETELKNRGLPPPARSSRLTKIGHRLFSFITMNRRGKSLVSLERIINLIADTTTSTGIEVYARLDEVYPTRPRSPTPSSRA